MPLSLTIGPSSLAWSVFTVGLVQKFVGTVLNSCNDAWLPFSLDANARTSMYANKYPQKEPDTQFPSKSIASHVPDVLDRGPNLDPTAWKLLTSSNLSQQPFQNSCDRPYRP